jgi:hypothetical protein
VLGLIRSHHAAAGVLSGSSTVSSGAAKVPSIVFREAAFSVPGRGSGSARPLTELAAVQSSCFPADRTRRIHAEQHPGGRAPDCAAVPGTSCCPWASPESSTRRTGWLAGRNSAIQHWSRRSRPSLGRARGVSGRSAHLLGMETTNAQLEAIEPVLSMSELAARLGVSVQTPLRSPQPGPRFSWVPGRSRGCAFAPARSTHAWDGWRWQTRSATARRARP